MKRQRKDRRFQWYNNTYKILIKKNSRVLEGLKKNTFKKSPFIIVPPVGGTMHMLIIVKIDILE